MKVSVQRYEVSGTKMRLYRALALFEASYPDARTTDRRRDEPLDLAA